MKKRVCDMRWFLNARDTGVLQYSSAVFTFTPQLRRHSTIEKCPFLVPALRALRDIYIVISQTKSVSSRGNDFTGYKRDNNSAIDHC